MANQAPYIPPTDAAFDTWLLNFSTLLTANPVNYGLIAGDAVIVAAEYTAWHPLYLAATNPATKTSPAVAAKDAARNSAEATVRPYAVGISLNPSVSDALKLGIGVNLPNNAPVPIPPILTNPVLMFVAATPGQHQLQYRDSATPTAKAKPFGATGLQLTRFIGVAAGVSPEQGTVVGTWTKTPNVSTFPPGNEGKLATYWGRWITRSGATGQAQLSAWSNPLVATIV